MAGPVVLITRGKACADMLRLEAALTETLEEASTLQCDYASSLDKTPPLEWLDDYLAGVRAIIAEAQGCAFLLKKTTGGNGNQ